MPTRKASAVWEKGLKNGKGTFKGDSGAINGTYSFGSRFENAAGSNPEELLADVRAVDPGAIDAAVSKGVPLTAMCEAALAQALLASSRTVRPQRRLKPARPALSTRSATDSASPP